MLVTYAVPCACGCGCGWEEVEWGWLGLSLRSTRVLLLPYSFTFWRRPVGFKMKSLPQCLYTTCVSPIKVFCLCQDVLLVSFDAIIQDPANVKLTNS